MIFTFTDFGAEGPYLGQMVGVLSAMAPNVPVINLLSNAPKFDSWRSSYLLAALSSRLPLKAIVLAVVDPGVGGDRECVCLHADGRFFVGPDNGLLDGVAQQALYSEWSVIRWRPEKMSSTFHGRDLLAPIAARIALADFNWGASPWQGPDLSRRPVDLFEVIYEDVYGNALTGIRYHPSLSGQLIQWEGNTIREGRTFSDVPRGEVFWYENSAGLVEIARNGGPVNSGATPLLGMPIRFSSGGG